MGGGLIIIDSTTILRDWIRAGYDEHVYIGGVPQTAPTEYVVMTKASTRNDGLVSIGAYQFDCYAAKASTAERNAARIATFLVRAPLRVTIGSNDDGSVIFAGADTDSVNLFALPEGNPEEHRHVLLITLLTIAVPTPTP